MLWSDPVDNDTGASENAYKHNEVRGKIYFKTIRLFLYLWL